MIKLGCFAFMYERDNETLVDPKRFVKFAYELGLDAVEFDLNKAFPTLDHDYLFQLKQECQRYGLQIGFLSGKGGSFVRSERGADGEAFAVVTPEPQMQEQIELAKERVDTAVFLSAPMILLGAGGVPDGLWWDPMIAAYREVCEYAAAKGITVGIQNHPPVTPPTGQEVLRIFEAVARDNFTIVMDTGQWWGSPGSVPKGETDPAVDFYQYMEETIPHASYVRAKIFNIDSGRDAWFDYERILGILRGANYNGVLSIYYLGKNYSACDDFEGITRAVRFLRDLLSTSGAQP